MTGPPLSLAAFLSPMQARIYAAVRASMPEGIDIESLTGRVYADDADGGPEYDRKSVHVHISRMNKTLRSFDIQVRAVHLRYFIVTNAVAQKLPHTGKIKLTPDNVRVIRSGGKSQGAFARQFGVSNHAIQSVLSRRTWKHVP